MWVNTTFSKAFKNPFVKNMVFILFPFFFLSVIFFSFIQLLPPLLPGENKREISKDIYNCLHLGPGDLQWICFKWDTPHGK